ncbi:MAG TPA: ABC transporter ATP-binding protein [Terriglobia bacterium]|nr:ABC transporter ATP-binding protein [Terriglobia bacterium]
MMPAAIRIRGLSKRYRSGILANANLTLNVHEGELLALLGPNGSGKTTLVRQVTTEMRPSEGAIEIMGIDAVRHGQRVKEIIGVVPQEAELFEHLTVEQHLFYFALFRGLGRPSARKCVENAIDELQLGERRKDIIKHLSSGLKRRVLVAIALLSDPPVLILDEPTTGLDPGSRRALWQVLLERKRRGTTMILTTHYLEEAELLADRIGILSHGKLIALGTLSELRGKARVGGLLDESEEGLMEVYFRFIEEKV